MNDVTIEFASSKYTSLDEGRIPTGKVIGDFKVYHVVAGSTFSFCYNETLDSATVLLSHVAREDKLSNLKPFEYVSVYNIETNKRHTYLVDNFNEVEDNINEHIFSYTINLMSETKILEKIQCPNVANTHKLNDGTMSRKTIYELICQYMELYCPKVKFTDDYENWHYEPIIKIPENGSSFYNKFNVTSADLPLTTPTMRQLLTTLMQQVGCIPTVENGVLGYLDFQVDAQPFGYMNQHNVFVKDFTVKNTVNKITRSLSSDSYANTIVDMSSNVLDTNNEVICETLGFRDKNNILLRQKENLKLETKFPIYKVNEFKINFIAMEKNIPNFDYNLNDDFWPNEYFNSGDTDLNFHVKITGQLIDFNGYFDNNGYLTEQAWGNAKVRIKDDYLSVSRLDNFHIKGKLHIIYFENEWKDLKVIDIDKRNTTSSNVSLIEINLGAILTREEITQLNVYYGSFYFEGTLDFYDQENDGKFPQPVTIFISDIKSASMLFTVDITPLLVENSQRQMLKTNFLDSDYEQAYTIQELAKYIYGTVGYSIGSNEISGFSTTFSKAETTIFGTITKDYTYIENIETFLLRFISAGTIDFTVTHLQGIPVVTDEYKGVSTQLTFSSLSNFSAQYFANLVNFVTCFFDIKYQPLNSFNLSFVKKREDVDYLIEQYTSGANGLTDFDRLSIHQQEVVDRIGNETLVIHQRTTNFSDIQQFNGAPRYFLDDLNRDSDLQDENEDIKHIVFKIEYSINDYYYTVSYTASKDSILKNYFTSIRTKYRAYRFVGYNDSILRKEKDVIFVRIGEDYYDGDDRIYLPNNDYEHFIDGCVHYGTNYNGNISYAAEKGDRVPPSSNIPTYNSGNTYNETDYVEYNDKIYQCLENGVTGTFDETKWNEYPLVINIKNDVSIITNSNSFALIYEEMDNAGPGSYITNSTFDKSLEYSDLTNWNDQKVGGVPQSWILWEDSYNEAHEVFFLKYLNFYETDMFSEGTLDGSYLKIALYDSETLKEAAQMPIVDTDYMLTNVQQYAFYVVDDNSDAEHLTRTFYKDYSERINHTVQFIYYRSSDSIRWSEHFIKNNSFIDQEGYIRVGYVTGSSVDDFDSDNWFNEEEHITYSPSSTIHSLGSIVTIDTTGVVPCIKVDWNGVNSAYIKVVGVFKENVAYNWAKYYDIIAFKNPNDNSIKRYYITLNDTKTDWVMARKSNILYHYDKVRTNTLSRVFQNASMLSFVFDNTQVSSIKVVKNGSTRYYYAPITIGVSMGDTYSWEATSVRGYHIITSSGSGTISTTNTTITIESRPSVYTLQGTSLNGTVEFFTSLSSSTPITTARYGDLVAYKITADTGFDAPLIATNYISVNIANFTTIDDVNEIASVELPECTIKTFLMDIYATNGTVSGSYYNPYSDETVTISVASGGHQECMVEYGGSYDFDFEIDSTNYYYDGSRANYYDDEVLGPIGTINCKATHYRTIQIVKETGVESIHLVVKRGNTTVSDQVYTQNATLPNLRIGDVYSWTATASQGYNFGPGYPSSATNIQIVSSDGNTITLSPITEPLKYTLTLTGKKSLSAFKVNVTWTLNGNTVSADKVVSYSSMYNKMYAEVYNVPTGASYTITFDNAINETTYGCHRNNNTPITGTMPGHNEEVAIGNIGKKPDRLAVKFMVTEKHLPASGQTCNCAMYYKNNSTGTVSYESISEGNTSNVHAGVTLDDLILSTNGQILGNDYFLGYIEIRGGFTSTNELVVYQYYFSSEWFPSDNIPYRASIKNNISANDWDKLIWLEPTQ